MRRIILLLRADQRTFLQFQTALFFFDRQPAAVHCNADEARADVRRRGWKNPGDELSMEKVVMVPFVLDKDIAEARLARECCN